MSSDDIPPFPMEIRRSTFFVLAALLDGPLHGYAIIGRASELSGGELRLSTGTLFGALDRLTDAGLVEAGEEEKVEGRVRRSYTLTQDGHAALAAEAGRLRRAAAVVEVRVAKAAT
jgi:DNA-binding PadR family transcriptional regulator